MSGGIKYGCTSIEADQAIVDMRVAGKPFVTGSIQDNEYFIGPVDNITAEGHGPPEQADQTI
jgi:hypothetical protein